MAVNKKLAFKSRVKAVPELAPDTPIAMFGGRAFGSLTRTEKAELFIAHANPKSQYHNPIGPTLIAVIEPATMTLELVKKNHEDRRRGGRIAGSKKKTPNVLTKAKIEETRNRLVERSGAKKVKWNAVALELSVSESWLRKVRKR